MSGFIVAAFASLLVQQQAEPHPSTLSLYQAPAIRPFEPPSDFGRETAQGDGDAEAHRRPLEAPVSVDRYARSYEFTPSDSEAAYEQGVASAEIRVDQTAGPLDGVWQVSDEAGRPLFSMVISDRGAVVEGGWRGPDGSGAATVEGLTLTLEALGVLTLQAHGGGWRGTLTGAGRPGTVTVSRPG
ncbi:MAG: hypothetical protein ACT6TH_04970 [Brevundimonas sp.]|uniref:hypothetical protein n=1 Tax=Brevundimonas sp. TaxID=1871086 RepID=UPI004034573E